MGIIDNLNIDLNDVNDIAPAIEKLLPLAKAGVKTAIGLIRDLSDIWSKDELSDDDRNKLIANRKAALADLKSHQFPTS